MSARIYNPSKNAMQSGKSNSGEWVLEYEPEAPRKVEPLMGYTSSTDMNSQLRIAFPSLDEAVAYAEKNGIAHVVQKSHSAKRRKIAYADNFSYNRTLPWTH